MNSNPRHQTATFVRIVPLVVAGILLGRWLDVEWWLTAVGCGVCIGGALVANMLRTKGRSNEAKEDNLTYKRVANIYIAAAIIMGSMTSATLNATPTDMPYGERLAVMASVEREYKQAGTHNRYHARIKTEGGKSYLVELRADTALHIATGDKLALRCSFSPMSSDSYGRLMHHRGVSGKGYISRAEDVVKVGTTTSFAIMAQRCQAWLLERFERLGVEGDTEAVCKAMTFGERQQMSPSLRESYSRSGCAHLLAISGLHVGIVAMLVWLLCGLMPIAVRHGHIWRNVICSAVMIAYAFVTGGSPSVLRATLMFCTAQLTLAYGTTRSTIGSLAGAITLMLLANPNNLYDISFQLSALAVAGIMTGYTLLFEPLRTRSVVVNYAWGVTVVGVCATLTTLPLVAHTFGVVSLVGVVLNPVVIATAHVVVLGSLVWTLLPWEPLQAPLKAMVEWAAELQNGCVEVVGSLPWGAVDMTPPAWVVIVGYLAMAAVLAAAVRNTRKNRKTEWIAKS